MVTLKIQIGHELLTVTYRPETHRPEAGEIPEGEYLYCHERDLTEEERVEAFGQIYQKLK